MSTFNADGTIAAWFGRLFEDLAEAYPSMRVRAGQVKVYAQALQDLTPDQIRAAMGRAILDNKFFPSVAELRAYVLPMPDDAAVLAWAALEQAASKIGAWQSLECEDPCVAEALLVAAGDWPSFCALEEGPQKMVVRQSFLAAFKDARRKVPVGAPPLRCAGLLPTGPSRAGLAVGRITARGEVVAGREASELPAGQTGRLTDGQA